MSYILASPHKRSENSQVNIFICGMGKINLKCLARRLYLKEERAISALERSSYIQMGQKKIRGFKHEVKKDLRACFNNATVESLTVRCTQLLLFIGKSLHESFGTHAGSFCGLETP